MVTEERRGVARKVERTLMYSIEGGRVIEHKLPWDRGNENSVAKFEKLLRRGFTFERPVVAPVVTEGAVVEVPKVEAGNLPDGKEVKETVSADAPLYVSEKPKKKKKAERKK